MVFGILLLLSLLAPADFETEWRAARREVVPGLAELAEWAGQNRLYLEKARLYRRVIELDPEHEEARKALKYRKERSGEWKQSSSYRDGRNRNDAAMPELESRRTALMDGWVNRSLDLLLEHQDRIRPERLSEAVRELEAAAPTHARLRQLLGEREFEGRWLRAESVEAIGRRRALKAFVEEAWSTVPEVEAESPKGWEAEFRMEWTTALKTPRFRVMGTIDAETGKKAARALEVAHSLFAEVFGAPPDDAVLTAYLLDDPREIFPLVDDRGDFPPGERRYLGDHEGTWIGGDAYAVYPGDDATAVDGAVYMAVFRWFSRHLELPYGQRHWAGQAVAHNFTRRVLGTHLFFLKFRPKYADPRGGRPLPERTVGYLQEAGKLLSQPTVPSLPQIMREDRGQLDEPQIIISYAVWAYFLEGSQLPYGLEMQRQLERDVEPGLIFEEVLKRSPLDFARLVARWCQDTEFEPEYFEEKAEGGPAKDG